MLINGDALFHLSARIPYRSENIITQDNYLSRNNRFFVWGVHMIRLLLLVIPWLKLIAQSIPDALAFTERLDSGLKPSDIVIYSGGFAAPGKKRQYGEISAASLRSFAAHHGYQLAFLDELEYDRRLVHGNVHFAPNWHKIFALTALQAAYPQALFYVWFDDDILVPFPETDMLNHYLNAMYRKTAIQIMVADEGAPFMLNTGIMLMANSWQMFQISKWMLDVGLEDGYRLARSLYHEQDALHKVRARYNFKTNVSVIGHRHGLFNINTFARWDAPQDAPETRARKGDAFVHFLGYQHDERLVMMTEWMEDIRLWRAELKGPITNQKQMYYA